MDRRDRKKENTRKRLLEAALRIFAVQGIYTTRIEDITEGADIGKGAFYNYFASKSDLIAVLLHQATERFSQEHLAAARALPPGAARIRAIVEGHQAFWEACPDYALLFHQARGLLLLEPESSTALQAAFQDHLQRVADLLPDGDGTASQRAGEALQAAAALVGLIAGHRSFAFAAGLRLDPELTWRIATRGLAGNEDTENPAPGKPVTQAPPPRS